MREIIIGGIKLGLKSAVGDIVKAATLTVVSRYFPHLFVVESEPCVEDEPNEEEDEEDE